MHILHRIAFNADIKPEFKVALDKMSIKYRIAPLPNNIIGLVYFDITESDPRWIQVKELIETKGASDIYDTIFGKEEILSAEWLRLIPTFEQGYPQPKATWVTNPINYEGKCPQCGAGYRQVAPFRLAKEPRLGKHDFLCLYWTYTVFCTPRVLEALRTHNIQGYEVWEALLHKTGQPSRVVSQLVFPHIAAPGLLDKDTLQPETCPQCGLTKYGYHKRGYMHFTREALRGDVDILQTHEWFGSGGYGGHREILISHRLAKLILEEGWRGVRLKPLTLV